MAVLKDRSVPFVDVPAMMRVHGEKLEQALADVVRSGMFINGPRVLELEERMAERTGVAHAVACGSGTAAQQIVLMALGIGPGDEVLVPDFTFIATAEAVAAIGARLVMVDVDPMTFTMDPAAARAAMSDKVKAIVPVSLFGQPAAFDEFEALAEEFGVHCIEDACQSLGARLGERHSGGFGSCGFTSFYPSKPLGGIGDGGMVFTEDGNLADRVRLIREHGQVGRHEHSVLGVNSRLDALQAAALLVKEATFDAEVEMRRAHAHRYDSALSNSVTTPVIAEGRYSSYAQYTICMPDAGSRDHFVEFLSARGVPTALHYPRPIHTQVSLQAYQDRFEPVPVTEQLCDTVISIPLSAYMSEKDQDQVISSILSWSEQRRSAVASAR
ncbi:aminotransferase DegT [bacterium]|nr:MAG: aminotransferase DegT [bacterium]